LYQSGVKSLAFADSEGTERGRAHAAASLAARSLNLANAIAELGGALELLAPDGLPHLIAEANE
jgi:hypothetical protein